jgi:aminopeptidase N
MALYPETLWDTSLIQTIHISYEATPTKGLYFVGWDDPTQRAPKQIWTQGQGIDHRHWIPHVDSQNDKLVTSLTIYFDEDYEVISNGILVSKKSAGNGKTVTSWSMTEPHSSYLIMLAIGRYQSYSEFSARGTRLVNHYYPEWENRNPWTYYRNKEIFDFIEEEIGIPYPWGPQYQQVPVANFQHGAMENTTSTIFGDFFCADSISFNDRNYVGVNAHELAHQWFGDLVTSYHSRDHWLHEGFASYYAWQAEKHIFGKEQYELLRWKSLNKILAAEDRDFYPLAHGKAGTERFYDKGAWVLEILRHEVGDSTFRRGLQTYLKYHAYSHARTEDLMEALEHSAGKSLQNFFKQWVFKAGLPEMHIQIKELKKTTEISFVQQLPAGREPFQLAFNGVLITNERNIPFQLNMKDKTATMTFKFGKKEQIIGFNPDTAFIIPAKWQLSCSPEITRRLSAHPQNWYPLVDVIFRDSLARIAFAKGNHTDLTSRVYYAQKLSGVQLIPSEIDFLAQSQETEVIKAFLNEAENIPAALIPAVRSWLKFPSYEICMKSLLLLFSNDPLNMEEYLKSTEEIVGTEGRNVEIMRLLIAIVMKGDQTEESLTRLTDLTGPSYDFLTRMGALETAMIVGFINPDIAANAFGAILQNNRKLRNEAKEFIVEAGKNTRGKQYFQSWMNENAGRLTEAQLERIKSLTGYEVQLK